MIDVFKVDVSIDLEKFELHNVREHPAFRLHGLRWVDGRYERMPKAVADTLNPTVQMLSAGTTGGRVRFCTDSKELAVRVLPGNVYLDANTTTTCNIGFDLYYKTQGAWRFWKVIMPPYLPDEGGYDWTLPLPEGGMNEYMIHFPMGSGVRELFLGVERGANLQSPGEYALSRPVVFYGSSITMGKCATRPGMTYEAILSRRLDFDFINLGFGGGAKGEAAMAEYIASLDMSLFVMDYDHNAPNVEHLQATHQPFFRIVREKRPDLPILLLSRPKFYLTEEEKARRAVVEATYQAAKAQGDTKVFFVPGDQLIDPVLKDDATVDGTHPTDAGFLSMANALEDLVHQTF